MSIWFIEGERNGAEYQTSRLVLRRPNTGLRRARDAARSSVIDTSIQPGVRGFGSLPFIARNARMPIAQPVFEYTIAAAEAAAGASQLEETRPLTCE
jgi:hypothetical protein